MDFSKIKVIVFDLDGTLYEDTHHFDYYANLLKAKLPSDKHLLFEKDYLAIKNEDHPMRIGRIYDVINDLILVQVNNDVQEAYTWDGSKLPMEKVEQLYPEPIEFNFTTMLSVGDSWWTPVSVAAHYGLDSKQSYNAFLETREYMMGPEFEMDIIPSFKETLDKIRQNQKLVLLTNSPEQDSETILTKIGLHDVFDLKIFNGEKPVRTLERFEYITNFFNVDYKEIVSIGDNWINEIHPVQTLGCSTIFIDTYGIKNEGSADLVVRSIKEVIPMLKEFKI